MSKESSEWSCYSFAVEGGKVVHLIKMTPLSSVSGMSNSKEASWLTQDSGRLWRSNTPRLALECLSVAGEKQVWNTLLSLRLSERKWMAGWSSVVNHVLSQFGQIK